MKRLNLKLGAAVFASTAIWVCAGGSAIAATTVDLRTAGASGTILGAFFQQIDPQSTGTGIIEPFLRLQAEGNEAGYNTSADKAVFDDKTGIWTHDLLLSTLAVVNNGGVPSYQFLLDVNQNSGSDHENLSLNQLQIFQSNVANRNDGSVDKDTGYLTGLAGVTKNVYDMNPTSGTDGNVVLLDYSLNSGSGSGDMFLYIPVSAFGAGAYVTLYSQFGNPPGTYGSNDGFEEWSATVPEPTTMIAGALLLLPFGASTLRVLRNRKA